MLAGGGTGSLGLRPGPPENDIDDPRVEIGGADEVVRIYTRFRTQSGEPLLFEAYYSLAEIDQRQDEIVGSFRWITIGGPLLLVLLVDARCCGS